MAGEGTSARSRRIPEATVVRLPVYQRILAELLRSGTSTVSSEELAERAGLNAAKVRKDFSLFGSFGTRGTGYDAAFLATQIEHALGADRDWPVLIVGMGNLGRALANSEGFRSHGFRVAGLYDVDPTVVGTSVGGRVVAHVDELIAARAVGVAEAVSVAEAADAASPARSTEPVLPTDPIGPAGPTGSLGGDAGGELGVAGGCAGAGAAIGVIATPAGAAQSVADLLVAAGADAILNFAPRALMVPPGVLVRNVDLSIELQAMSFFLVRRHAGGTRPDLRTGAGTS